MTSRFTINPVNRGPSCPMGSLLNASPSVVLLLYHLNRLFLQRPIKEMNMVPSSPKQRRSCSTPSSKVIVNIQWLSCSFAKHHKLLLTPLSSACYLFKRSPVFRSPLSKHLLLVGAERLALLVSLAQ